MNELLTAGDIRQKIRTYFNWSCNQISGVNPPAVDQYLRDNLEDIKIAAQHLLNKINYQPGTIYRGIIMQQEITELQPHENLTYLSFSEDIKIAERFANHYHWMAMKF